MSEVAFTPNHCKNFSKYFYYTLGKLSKELAQLIAESIVLNISIAQILKLARYTLVASKLCQVYSDNLQNKLSLKLIKIGSNTILQNSEFLGLFKR